MYRHPLTARLAVVALAVTATAPVAHGHGRASWNVAYPEQVMVFPDTEPHVTMIADLHTHTVFSDGHVWPNIRVAEAVRDGLDAVAITDHLEYQPHRALVPNPDRNAAVTEARMAAAGEDVIVIAGSEITRDPPAGHMNAVFVEDANALWPIGDRSGARATLQNASSAVLRLRHVSTAAQSFHGAADLVNVAPRGRTELVVKPAEPADEVVLEFEVLNALTAPNTHPRVVLRGAVAAPEGPASFRHEGSPAFTIEFPAGTRETAPDGPTQVFAASTPDGVTFQVSVTDFPAGILLPIEKAAEYFIELTAASGIGSDFEVTRNEEMTLGDGSPAYRSEVTWLYLPAAVTFETQIVSAYRGGRLVSVTAHPRQSSEHISKLVESLRFP